MKTKFWFTARLACTFLLLATAVRLVAQQPGSSAGTNEATAIPDLARDDPTNNNSAKATETKPWEEYGAREAISVGRASKAPLQHVGEAYATTRITTPAGTAMKVTTYEGGRIQRLLHQ